MPGAAVEPTATEVCVRRWMGGAVVAAGLWALLGCSGMMEGMEEGMKEAAVEKLGEAEEAVRGLDRSKEKIALGKMVGEVQGLAESDDANWIAITTFAVLAYEACEDGSVSQEELDAAQAALDAMNNG